MRQDKKGDWFGLSALERREEDEHSCREMGSSVGARHLALGVPATEGGPDEDSASVTALSRQQGGGSRREWSREAGGPDEASASATGEGFEAPRPNNGGVMARV